MLAKTQQYDKNEDDYVLIEELCETYLFDSLLTTNRHFEKKMSVDSLASINFRPKNKFIYHVLKPNENIWKRKNQWKIPGRFLLEKFNQISKFERNIAKVYFC